MDRRDFIRTGLAAGTGALTNRLEWAGSSSHEAASLHAAAFKHSVSRWCYGQFSVDELARAARDMGIQSVELLHPEDWPTVQQYGLTCAMANPPGDVGQRITTGWNHIEHHEELIPAYEERLRETAEAGLPHLICFSGNRNGLSDTEGLTHCAEGLRQITPLAEELGVTLCMELLNSKVDHPGYQADHTAWGADLVERVGSDRFRLLYDIYHMQIMEGDVIRTIRTHADAIAHYHTAGVPGRHEIDDTQELFYPAIMRAIAETGFTGYVAQEFVPAGDPLASLRAAIETCTVSL